MPAIAETIHSDRTAEISAVRTEQSFAFRVADTCFGIFAAGDVPLVLDSELREFATEPSACDMRIHAKWAEEIETPVGTATFNSGGLWSVFDDGSECEFYFSTPYLGSKPYKKLRMNRDFRSGQLWLRRGRCEQSQGIYPLEYPVDELLMIHRLGRGEGVELHAMGLVDEVGRGHLFLGHSGAGKSTTARLWQKETRALILSDDRIILRERKGRIWMHGTPWHGDAGIASPEAAPLYRAYLLEHGSKTDLIGIRKGRAAAEFLARSFVPHYSADAMAFTLGFLERVAQDTPCYIFRFFPDKSAVEAIRSAND